MDILSALGTFHNYWRYVVLVVSVVALVVALGGWLGPLPQRLMLQSYVRKVASMYIIAIDLQALIGIILWLGLGGLSQARPFRLEHPLIMLLAVVAAHAGSVMAKRARMPAQAARAVAIAVIVSLILVLIGIPGIMLRAS